MSEFLQLSSKEQAIALDIPHPEIKGQPTVFIDKITLSSAELEILGSHVARDIYLFGAMVKTGEVHSVFGELKRLELIAVERKTATGDGIFHHLAQHNSVMYKRDSDDTTTQCVDMLAKKDIRFLRRLPRWKASDASIPVYQQQLFYFCRQIYLPDNKTNRQYMTWEASLFVFLFVTEQDELLIQLFSQDTSEQTAEDHYRLEEMMLTFEQHYHDPVQVLSLIRQGDKYFHDYVLQHPKTNRETLALLLEYGKSKAFKAQVARKLR